MGWVCCWFFPLLQEVFLRVLRFSSLLKIQQIQIPIRPAIRQVKNNTDYVDVPPLNRYLLIHYYYYFLFSKFTESSRTSCLTRGARLAKSRGLIIPHGLWVSSHAGRASFPVCLGHARHRIFWPRRPVKTPHRDYAGSRSFATWQMTPCFCSVV